LSYAAVRAALGMPWPEPGDGARIDLEPLACAGLQKSAMSVLLESDMITLL